jgi:hypothetical protein
MERKMKKLVAIALVMMLMFGGVVAFAAEAYGPAVGSPYNQGDLGGVRAAEITEANPQGLVINRQKIEDLGLDWQPRAVTGPVYWYDLLFAVPDDDDDDDDDDDFDPDGLTPGTALDDYDKDELDQLMADFELEIGFYKDPTTGIIWFFDGAGLREVKEAPTGDFYWTDGVDNFVWLPGTAADDPGTFAQIVSGGNTPDVPFVFPAAAGALSDGGTAPKNFTNKKFYEDAAGDVFYVLNGKAYLVDDMSAEVHPAFAYGDGVYRYKWDPAALAGAGDWVRTTGDAVAWGGNVYDSDFHRMIFTDFDDFPGSPTDPKGLYYNGDPGTDCWVYGNVQNGVTVFYPATYTTDSTTDWPSTPTFANGDILYVFGNGGGGLTQPGFIRVTDDSTTPMTYEKVRWNNTAGPLGLGDWVVMP